MAAVNPNIRHITIIIDINTEETGPNLKFLNIFLETQNLKIIDELKDITQTQELNGSIYNIRILPLSIFYIGGIKAIINIVNGYELTEDELRLELIESKDVILLYNNCKNGLLRYNKYTLNLYSDSVMGRIIQYENTDTSMPRFHIANIISKPDDIVRVVGEIGLLHMSDISDPIVLDQIFTINLNESAINILMLIDENYHYPRIKDKVIKVKETVKKLLDVPGGLSYNADEKHALSFYKQSLHERLKENMEYQAKLKQKLDWLEPAFAKMQAENKFDGLLNAEFVFTSYRLDKRQAELKQLGTDLEKFEQKFNTSMVKAKRMKAT